MTTTKDNIAGDIARLTRELKATRHPARRRMITDQLESLAAKSKGTEGRTARTPETAALRSTGRS